MKPELKNKGWLIEGKIGPCNGPDVGYWIPLYIAIDYCIAPTRQDARLLLKSQNSELLRLKKAKIYTAYRIVKFFA